MNPLVTQLRRLPATTTELSRDLAVELLRLGLATRVGVVGNGPIDRQHLWRITALGKQIIKINERD